MPTHSTSLPAEPPPFFKRGPSPLARLTFFGVASLTLMFIDARFRTLETVRMAIATVIYPVQQAALVPGVLARDMAEFFQSRTALRQENAALKAELLDAEQARQALTAAQLERERLQKLLQIAQTGATRAQATRVAYLGRDPFSQKLFIERSGGQSFEPGSAVVDEAGLLGQVTRVHPLLAEVTMLTEKDFAVPVKIERTGGRALLYGRGPGKLPELRYVASNADVREGDVVLTSAIDGLYPGNVRVGRIGSVQRDAESAFARVECVPSAHLSGAERVLVLDKPAALPARPNPDDTAAEPVRRKRR
ncbi:MAG: rod shape-determining protein MreC [Burkholderiales bacterium]|nr:rod shape-determining protein MreC [Burkholderiales bacterium]